MSKRIIGDIVNINYDETLKFFEERGAKTDLKYLYNHTMYQDSNPDIVIERDRYEKNRITQLLEFNSNDKVLDIGCGVGRWGEEVLRHGSYYVGFDFSQNLLSLAEENLSRFPKERISLVHCSFQDMMTGIKKSNIKEPFNKVIITGVFVYLNDTDVIEGLNNLVNIITDDCIIYLKETMAISDRLTLNKFYSEELKTEYDAIYRSISEYRKILQKSLLNHNFEVIYEDELYPPDLKNRKETTQYFFILQRK